jgi:hypothetical protein
MQQQILEEMRSCHWLGANAIYFEKVSLALATALTGDAVLFTMSAACPDCLLPHWTEQQLPGPKQHVPQPGALGTIAVWNRAKQSLQVCILASMAKQTGHNRFHVHTKS